MTISPLLVQDVLVAITIVGGSALYYKGRLPRQTVKDLQAHVQAQDLIIGDMQKERDSDRQALANLQGQLKVYKDIPLKELADGINKVNAMTERNFQVNTEVAASNEKILGALTSSAVTLVRDTQDAKTAVQGVKIDLALSNKEGE